MKILIDNGGYEFKNHGDSAMLILIASRFKTSFPSALIHIFTSNPEELKAAIPYAIPILLDGRRQWSMSWNLIGGLYKLFPRRLHRTLQSKEALFKLKYPLLSRRLSEKRLSKRGYNIEAMRHYLDEIESADVVVACGGGYITDSFKDHASSLLHTIGLAQFYGKTTALFGQGLGPVESKDLLTLSRSILPKLDMLAIRENLFSNQFAQSVGVPASIIKVTGDDAIALAYSKVPIMLGKSLGINLRVASYSGLKENIIEEVKSIFIQTALEFECEIIPIPISIHQADSDLLFLRSILSNEAIEYVNQLSTFEDIIEQVSHCRLVVTGSYHAAVFALSQGISVVAIVASKYYRHKFEGLAYQFVKGCMTVEQDSDSFSDDLKDAIRFNWNNAPLARNNLLNQAKIQIDKSESAFNNFVEKIRKYD